MNLLVIETVSQLEHYSVKKYVNGKFDKAAKYAVEEDDTKEGIRAMLETFRTSTE